MYKLWETKRLSTSEKWSLVVQEGYHWDIELRERFMEIICDEERERLAIYFQSVKADYDTLGRMKLGEREPGSTCIKYNGYFDELYPGEGIHFDWDSFACWLQDWDRKLADFRETLKQSIVEAGVDHFLEFELGLKEMDLDWAGMWNSSFGTFPANWFEQLIWPLKGLDYILELGKHGPVADTVVQWKDWSKRQPDNPNGFYGVLDCNAWTGLKWTAAHWTACEYFHEEGLDMFISTGGRGEFHDVEANELGIIRAAVREWNYNPILVIDKEEFDFHSIVCDECSSALGYKLGTVFHIRSWNTSKRRNIKSARELIVLDEE